MTEEQNLVLSTMLPDSVTESANAESSPHTEKMIPQSEVNKIVGASKKAAYEKAKQEMSELQASYAQESRQEPVKRASGENNLDDLVDKAIDRRVLAAQASEEAEVLEAQKRALIAEDQKVRQSLLNKINEASKKYPDFETVVGQHRWDLVPGLIKEMDGFENSTEMMKHMAENPEKFSLVAQNLMNPNLIATGKVILKKLSESLKNMEKAEKNGTVRNPISQVRPSNVGADDGKMSRAELRIKYRV